MAKFLTTKEFSNVARAEDRFRFGVLSDARKNLAMKRRRTSPNPNRGSYTSATNSTKTLSYSLKSKRKNLDIQFSMEYYGYWVDQGRKPGKQPPPKVIQEWIRKKPIRPRDKRGRYIAKTEATMNSLAYLIGRSIGKYGYKKTQFFSEPFEKRYRKLGDDIRSAIMRDFDIYFT